MDGDFKKLCDIIADVLGIDPEEITMDTTFDDDLGADSLDIASIIMAIEDEYDISVYEEAYDEYVKGGCKSTPVEDFWKELDGEI